MELLNGNGDEAAGLDLPDISGSGFVWDISQFTTNGSIAIVLIPEPSRLLLGALGFAALFLRRRRDL
ncbi:PEP-CTERM sorting domain-containing protein [Prosthecobacter sp. SYSU 5D2]|uniref:PEP-CTERM sorting domain-containing protein n=1 Tax=Prosthecobacter sp. SYSU 5D2 TaxID=3134134 RepID=UPI0031FEB299